MYQGRVVQGGYREEVYTTQATLPRYSSQHHFWTSSGPASGPPSDTVLDPVIWRFMEILGYSGLGLESGQNVRNRARIVTFEVIRAREQERPGIPPSPSESILSLY